MMASHIPLSYRTRQLLHDIAVDEIMPRNEDEE
jgi:hypothetical protein